MSSIGRQAFHRGCMIVSGTLTILLGTTVAFSQPVIQVRGGKNPWVIERHVQAHLDQLDVQESIHLTIRFSSRMPEKLEGITFSLPSSEPDVYQLLKVLIDARLSALKQRLVLAHEMIHVRQYAKQELIILNDNVIWKGQNYPYAYEYNQRMPWEREAYRGDRTLAKLVNTSPNPMQETLAEQMPNRVSQPASRKCMYLTGKCVIEDQNASS